MEKGPGVRLVLGHGDQETAFQPGLAAKKRGQNPSGIAPARAPGLQFLFGLVAWLFSVFEAILRIPRQILEYLYGGAIREDEE